MLKEQRLEVTLVGGVAAHTVSHQSAAMFNDSFSKKLRLQVACRLALIPTKF
jgi:hypothetical protein